MSVTKLTFPEKFLWGAATSSYQVEGGVKSGGRHDSIWDLFCRLPGAIANNDNGDLACNYYELWEKDIAMMADLGIKAYRFSISWPRIIPDGVGALNEEGLEFYDKLIDALLLHHIEPVITLYHWDLPQHLQENGGWASRETVDAFVNYALICFARFNDRVKIWITHNEPWVVSMLGYRLGIHAPGISDPNQSLMAAHHLLLSHGKAVEAMRKYTPNFKGKIGISLNLNPVEPENHAKKEDIMAAADYDLLLNKFYLDALYKGKYPIEMEQQYPILSQMIKEGDMQAISAAIDFLGINYYTRAIVKGVYENEKLESKVCAFPNDYSSMMWEFYPQGITEIIERICSDYAPSEILITENGTALDDAISANGDVRDEKRIDYIQAHLIEIHHLFEKKIPITGYFAWSLMDNFEWAHGYQKRFGLVYIDFDSLKRIPKHSAKWYGNVCKSNEVSFI